MESNNQQKSILSFEDVVHEVPRLLEVSPPAALRNLSSTCRSLRTSVCARVNVITLSDPADVSKLCCTTGLQLVMVVCTSGSQLKSRLSAQWECLTELKVEVEVGVGFCTMLKNAMLIRPRQQLQISWSNLPNQYCAALSHFADKHRRTAKSITFWGPLIGRAVQSLGLTHGSWPVLKYLNVDESHLSVDSMCYLTASLHLTNITIVGSSLDASVLLKLSTGCPQLKNITLSRNQLDAKAISTVPPAKWPHLCSLSVDSNMLGTAGMQYLASCSWPVLLYLKLSHSRIDGPALQCLVSHWPALLQLNLYGNNIDATAVSHLVKGNWPLLHILVLSGQGLGEEAYSLLGIGEADIDALEQQSGIESRHLFKCKSGLPQYPFLHLGIYS